MMPKCCIGSIGNSSIAKGYVENIENALSVLQFLNSCFVADVCK
jgi:hypothetical protein